MSNTGITVTCDGGIRFVVFNQNSFPVVEEDGHLSIYEGERQVAVFARGSWDRVVSNDVGGV